MQLKRQLKSFTVNLWDQVAILAMWKIPFVWLPFSMIRLAMQYFLAQHSDPDKMLQHLQALHVHIEIKCLFRSAKKKKKNITYGVCVVGGAVLSKPGNAFFLVKWGGCLFHPFGSRPIHSTVAASFWTFSKHWAYILTQIHFPFGTVVAIARHHTCLIPFRPWIKAKKVFTDFLINWSWRLGIQTGFVFVLEKVS